MMLTELSDSKKKVIGTKQTLNVIVNGKAKKVYLAQDVDQHIIDKIIQVSKENNVLIETVESKLKLGRACGIDVAAACAALLK